jgi:hypothetical protein
MIWCPNILYAMPCLALHFDLSEADQSAMWSASRIKSSQVTGGVLPWQNWRSMADAESSQRHQRKGRRRPT